MSLALPARCLLAAAALCLGAAGCGGGDDGDGEGGAQEARRTTTTPAAGTSAAGPPEGASSADRRAIRRLLVRLFKTDDPRVTCEESLTPELLGRIYSGAAQCRKIQAEDDGEKSNPPKRIEVTRIRTSGEEATAHIRAIGGDVDGVRGTVALRRDGDGWRADDLSTPLLRSTVSADLEADDDVPPAIARCAVARLAQIPDEEFKRLAYSLLGQKDPATVRLFTTLSRCDRREVSLIRRPVEKAIAKQLRKSGGKKRAIGCVLRRLRRTVPEPVLIELAAKEDRRSTARITRELVAAAVACGGGRPPDASPEQLSPA
ncbi:MAG: hypothetical protein ACR2GL_01990 [Thermoleophilaceae bacterium]